MEPRKSTVRTVDAIAANRDDPDAIVEAGEVVDMRFPLGRQLSLRGAKLFHLLVQAAGEKIVDEVQHRLPLAHLNESFHRSVNELEELVEELHTTTLQLKLTDSQGRRFTKSGPILSDVEREEEAQVQAEFRFEFSPTLRRAIANSSHWAVISRRAVLAFESKYALRLYSVFALRAGLRKATETFALDDLREVLGVGEGKLTNWKDFRRRALEPAIAEINHLAGFHAGFVPVRRGKRIVGVTLTWGAKDQTGRVAALKELDRPRVGRKARRQGTVEEVLTAEGLEREKLAQALAEAPSWGNRIDPEDPNA